MLINVIVRLILNWNKIVPPVTDKKEVDQGVLLSFQFHLPSSNILGLKIHRGGCGSTCKGLALINQTSASKLTKICRGPLIFQANFNISAAFQ
eukprot:g47922.t1